MEVVLIGGAVVVLLLLVGQKAKADPAPIPEKKELPKPDPKRAPVKPPLTPGSSPALAVTRGGMWPGFDGYVQVSQGDTLILIAKMASKLDAQPIAWRSLRDDPENAWCRAQTPAAHLNTFGLSLVQCYGTTVGVDCEVVPGWRARKYSHNTGKFPILRVRQP